jgi:hypothetical protein
MTHHARVGAGDTATLLQARLSRMDAMQQQAMAADPAAPFCADCAQG